jgi:hypothetical protein
LQVDQHIKHQEMELVQQKNHQLLMLQQAAQQQKAALEQQANALLIEYNQKKAAEDLATQMSDFNNTAAEAHKKYEAEIRGLQQMQAHGAQRLAAQGGPPRQASLSNLQPIATQQVASRTSASLTAPMPTGHLTPRGSYLPQAPVFIERPPSSYLPPQSAILPLSSVPTVASYPTNIGGTVSGWGTPVLASGATTPRTTSWPGTHL